MNAPDEQALLDREAIRDCLYRYCRGIDRADEAALRSAYWPDATDCHGAWNGSASGFIDVAVVESAFFALQAPAATPTQATLLCGRYLDRFERRAGAQGAAEWRVAARTVVYDWIDERERPELAHDDRTLFGARQPVGTAAPHDAVYALLRGVRAPRSGTTAPAG
jgi:hypothetical protein